MKLSVLLFLVVAGSALASHEHRVLKLLASGVISGISGPEATVPEACFDASSSISLEDGLIKMFSDIVRGSESLSASQAELSSLLKSTLHSCGFDTCENALSKWNSSSEQLRLLINFVTTLPEGLPVLGKALEAAQNYHWEELGYNLGKYWKVLSEGSAIKSLLDTGYLALVEGVVLGLARRPVDTHPCYDNILAQSKYILPLLEGLYYSLVDGDKSKLDATLSLMAETSDVLYKACKVDKFMENVVGKLRSGSYTSFGTSLMMNMSEIRTTYEDMKKICGENWKECGRDLGKIVRLVLGWSI